ncbi:MAG: hypothetical protein ACFFAO_13435 [Candidatus Hermodarchaeota archaeon]
MSKTLDIGKEAKQLDEKNIYHRMKINPQSIKKILIAIFIYFLFMYIFYIFL